MSTTADDEIYAALDCIPACDRETWLKVAMALKSELGDDGFDAWDTWARAADNYRPADASAVWRSLRADGGVTIRSLFYIARCYAWRGVPATPRERPAKAPVVAFPSPAEQERVREEHRALAASLWREAAPLAGTMGERYLAARGVPMPPEGSELRLHADARAFGLRGPALVGRVSRAEDGREGVGAHVTFVEERNGVPVRTERRYVGSKAGAVVRLFPDSGVTTALGIGEGIESTLALHELARVPVWACLDAGNLAAFPVLPGIEVLHIAVDRDESGAGQRAALAVAERWLAAGREVVPWAADRIGLDLADVALGVAV